ncbi:hypothetical protein SAMN03080606_03988 [Alkaliphilus peptidifermentans DSM 18978]|uniref:Phosphatidylglycerol lysyltransferase n=2 Tax=Alkaliphilus TaxID=114627 RepID=A0A1G5L1Y3_9FIRM|nr:hypothetical protein SAMN03080606_03988 [Alkaliphilus peptidifermentans DSM 18978]
MQLVTIVLINFQWYSIAKIIGAEISFKDLLHMNLVGTFVESVTPSVKAGGETAKVYTLNKKLGLSIGRATAMVSIQKIVSIIAFATINLISIVGFLSKVEVQGLYLKLLLTSFLFLIGVLAIIIAFMVIPDKILWIFNKLSNRKFEEKLNNFLFIFQKTIKEAIKNKKAFSQQLLLSFIIWGFFAFKAIILARGLHLDIGLFTIAIITYITYMVAMVPLLPGGLGSFEGSMVFLLAPFGITLSRGMAFALALRFTTFWFVFFISAIYLAINTVISFITDIKAKGLNLVIKD